MDHVMKRIKGIIVALQKNLIQLFDLIIEEEYLEEYDQETDQSFLRPTGYLNIFQVRDTSQQGLGLKDFIQPLPLKQRCDIMRQVCSDLQDFHSVASQPLGNLSIDNIYLCESGQIHIREFNLQILPAMTPEQGEFLCQGPEYLYNSPDSHERCETDLWAIGCLILEFIDAPYQIFFQAVEIVLIFIKLIFLKIQIDNITYLLGQSLQSFVNAQTSKISI